MRLEKIPKSNDQDAEGDTNAEQGHSSFMSGDGRNGHHPQPSRFSPHRAVG